MPNILLLISAVTLVALTTIIGLYLGKSKLLNAPSSSQAKNLGSLAKVIATIVVLGVFLSLGYSWFMHLLLHPASSGQADPGKPQPSSYRTDVDSFVHGKSKSLFGYDAANSGKIDSASDQK